MTTPTPTPENQNSSEAPDSSKDSPKPTETGFFQRIRKGFNSEEPSHPTEAYEIVIMEGESVTTKGESVIMEDK